MSQFQELLAELSAVSEEQATLAKALPVEDGEDDEAIQAAAAEGADANTDANPEDAEGEGEGEGAGKPPMAKSVTAMVDGEEVEAIDATEMLKSLEARVDSNETILSKALETSLSAIKAQDEMIKSLHAEVKKLAGQGKGRKTVLTVVEKPAAGDQPLVKSQQDGLNAQEFMAKANAAFSAGKLTGKELTTIDVALRTGQASVLDQSLITKALS